MERRPRDPLTCVKNPTMHKPAFGPDRSCCLIVYFLFLPVTAMSSMAAVAMEQVPQRAGREKEEERPVLEHVRAVLRNQEKSRLEALAGFGAASLAPLPTYRAGFD
jgi:hypothetical protein